MPIGSSNIAVPSYKYHKQKILLNEFQLNLMKKEQIKQFVLAVFAEL